MYLYYDRVSKMCTLNTGDEVLFVGPVTHSVQKLREFDLTLAQARAAVLTAVFNMGDAVDILTIKKMTAKMLEFYGYGKHTEKET